MAMGFAQAQRAQNPDLLQATIEQGRIAAQLREAELAQRQGYLSSGATLAQNAPEGSWSNLGNAIMGGGEAAAGGNIATGTMIDPATGAMSSAIPEAAGSTGAAEAALGAQMSPAATGAAAETGAALAGTEAAAAAGAAEAATAAGAGAGAAGGGGIGGALAAMGPVGWAALAALALGATTG